MNAAGGVVTGMQQLVLDIGLAPQPSLANFVPSGNEAALEHLQLWLSNPLRSPVPTLLWGPSGSGKSHLLLAVQAGLLARGEAVGWLDPQSNGPQPFDDRWQALLLQDCHLFDAEQQAAAFNWFVNAQTPSQGRARWVLASADRPPADLALREDLRTRLGWGHVFQLHSLDDAQRRQVLLSAAAERGLALSPEVMDYMLSRFSRDLSSLMQWLQRLDAYALRTRRAITIPLIKSMLENE